MGLKTNFVKYETDDQKEVTVKINYNEDNSDDRLTAGGFDDSNIITNGCKSVTNRRLLKPRYIDTTDLGLIYFQSHEAWKDYIEPNKDKIKKVQGEKLSCTAVNLLY